MRFILYFRGVKESHFIFFIFLLYINSCFKFQRSLLKMYVDYETSSHNQNEQVQYVYHCCLCLIFDKITVAQEQKYLTRSVYFHLLFHCHYFPYLVLALVFKFNCSFGNRYF